MLLPRLHLILCVKGRNRSGKALGICLAVQQAEGEQK